MTPHAKSPQPQQHHAAAPQAPPHLPTARSRRGSAMILAISCVIFLLLVGLSFLSMTQLQRLAGSASARANNTDSAVDAAVQIAGRAIADDFIRYLTTNDPATQARAFATAATTNHPWLSANAPGPLLGTITAANLNWSQASWLGTGGIRYTNIRTGVAQPPVSTGAVVSVAVVNGGSGYHPATTSVTLPGGTPSATAQGVFQNGVLIAVNILTPGNYAATPTVVVNDTTMPVGSGASAIAFSDSAPAAGNPSIPFMPITQWNSDYLADASGSGYADSCWMELPIPSIDGQKWYGAFKIIDEGGMINPNHASEAETQFAAANVWGDTPADISFMRYLAQADLTDPIGWGPGFSGMDVPLKVGYALNTTNSVGSTGAMGYLYKRLGHFPSHDYSAMLPLTDVQRLAFWTTSRRIANPLTGFHPFDVSDMTELRLHGASNTKAWSPLEYTIDAGDPASIYGPYGPLRAMRSEVGYDTTNNVYNALNVAQYRADIRRHITVNNPSRPLRPRWLTGITTNSIQYISTTNTLDYQLPLNLATTNNTAFLDAFVSSLTAPGVNYEGSIGRGRETAYSLYANLCARLDTAPAGLINPERNKVVQDLGSGDQAVYYPMRAQPFIKEVSATVVYSDRPDGAGVGEDNPPDVTIDPANEPAERFLVIELGNPFKVPVDLTNFYIQVNTGADVPIAGSVEGGGTTIPVGGRLVIYTTNSTPTTASARFAESVKNGNNNGLSTKVEDDPTSLAGCPITWSGATCDVSLVYKNGADRFIADKIGWTANGTSTNLEITAPAGAIVSPGGSTISTAPAWPPAEIPGGTTDVSVGTNNWRYIISASLQRDDTHFHALDCAEAPRYVYEKPTRNHLELMTTNVVDPNDRIPIMHRMTPNNDGIKLVRILNPGKGYSGPTTITVDNTPAGPGPGTGATLTANVVNQRVVSASITAAGQGYVRPQLVFSVNGSQGLAVAAMGQKKANYVEADTSHFALPEMITTPLHNVGELGNLLTFAYTATTIGAATTYRTISDRLANPDEVGDLDKPNLGRLHFDKYLRSEAGLEIPAAATIFDHFTTLDITPVGLAALPPPVPGRVNINTAPPQVLSTLPYFRGLGARFTTHQAPLLDETLVAYRDKVQLTTVVDYSAISRDLIAFIPGLRSEFGMTSIGEPLMLRIKSNNLPALSPGAGATFTASVSAGSVVVSSDNAGAGYDPTYKPLIFIAPPDNPAGVQAAATANISADGVTGTSTFTGGSGYTTTPGVTVLSEADAYSIDRLGHDKVDADAPSGDPSLPDKSADDFKEQLLHYARMSNLITVHSDTFTAYIILQGRKYDAASNSWIKTTERRFVVGFDRSNVDGTAANRMPRITYFAEEH
ncbi:MAG: hypothetical protein NTW19_03425 [Planctomycetota bacterium]|nr:hypothetical protein [Planctomycetota bacterium]